MLDKAIGFGLGGALLFGGLTAAAIAAGWFLATMAAVIFLCAVLYCAAVIVEANAEAEPRPIADDVRRVKIKEKPWVRKYYDGEFDPEDDPSQSAEPTALPKGRACETASVPRAMRKFVI